MQFFQDRVVDRVRVLQACDTRVAGIAAKVFLQTSRHHTLAGTRSASDSMHPNLALAGRHSVLLSSTAYLLLVYGNPKSLASAAFPTSSVRQGRFK